MRCRWQRWWSWIWFECWSCWCCWFTFKLNSLIKNLLVPPLGQPGGFEAPILFIVLICIRHPYLLFDPILYCFGFAIGAIRFAPKSSRPWKEKQRVRLELGWTISGFLWYLAFWIGSTESYNSKNKERAYIWGVPFYFHHMTVRWQIKALQLRQLLMILHKPFIYIKYWIADG